MRAFFFCITALLSTVVFAKPDVYLFLGGNRAQQYKEQLNHKQITGAQIIYPWNSLEPSYGVYDFSAINQDLSLLNSMHKRLYIQIQDKSFSANVIPVPQYLIQDEKYHGGIAKQFDFPGQGLPKSSGWVAKQWVPALRGRFQKLLNELSNAFDGKVAGINLPETAIDLDENNLPPDFSCQKYFDSIIDNVTFTRRRFNKSQVIQYVNFFPCEWGNDRGYMQQLFAIALDKGIGVGGPDTIPFRKGHMSNSYPFLHNYHFNLTTVAMAIQEPDYSYINKETGRPFSALELYQFATQYLGAKVLFWNAQEPQFSQQVLPLLSQLAR